MVELTDIGQVLLTAAINAFSGLIANVFYILLTIWGVKTLVREVPRWIEKYDKIKIREMRVLQAKGGMGRE